VFFASFIANLAHLSRILGHGSAKRPRKQRILKLSKEGHSSLLVHHVHTLIRLNRLSVSSTLSKKSSGTQSRVIRTTEGTGVEEYDDLDGPSLLKKTLGLQNKHHSKLATTKTK